MPSQQTVVIYGHAGRDAEVRHTAAGNQITNVSVAVSSGKEGSEHTEWFRIVGFGSVGDELAKAKKGDLVNVSGKLKTREWEKSDGTKQKTTELIADMARVQAYKRKDADAPAAKTAAKTSFDDMDDDIPF
jgi:single-strand DNA-binding protein